MLDKHNLVLLINNTTKIRYKGTVWLFDHSDEAGRLE